ncbi:MAG TPA: DUF885 domain-containing protein [Vicinamibacterales bacterium]|nr:DUF885 domain-containing protein [Vicinamibacterales bacterium]
MTTTHEAATGDFHKFLDRDWAYWTAQFPEWATVIGERGHNDRWTDASPDAIAGRAAHARESARELARIDRAALSDADRLNLDLYRDLVDTATQGLAFHLDPFPIRSVVPRMPLSAVNQLEGVPQDVPMVLSLMPAESVADYEDMLARLRAVPRLVEQTIAQLAQGIALGLTPPAMAIRGVPAQVAAQLVDDAHASPMLEPFARFPSSIAPAERDRLRADAARVFVEHVRPAFVRLHAYLVDDYLPACRTTTGISSVPNGDALYAYLVRWHTTTPLSPKEIHEIGLDQVRRIRSEMADVQTRAGFTGSFEDFAAYLRTEPSFYFRDAASLLTAYRDICKRADPMLARFFGRLPRTPYGVLPVPDASAPSQTTAYYQPGSLVAGRAGNFYANTYNLPARPSWEMEALTLHEAVPGHHLQVALAQEMEGLPAFRKHASYTAYIEGWALYAERLGEEMGFYESPYAKFGQLTYEMWRAVRLVVDTGLHAFGWTRDRAIEFFAANTPKTPDDIAVEVDRYIVWPGQALGYKVGEIRICALRAKAEARLGTRFDLRAFHDLILGEGALPLDVLEQRVDEWTDRR